MVRKMLVRTIKASGTGREPFARPPPCLPWFSWARPYHFPDRETAASRQIQDRWKRHTVCLRRANSARTEARRHLTETPARITFRIVDIDIAAGVDPARVEAVEGSLDRSLIAMSISLRSTTHMPVRCSQSLQMPASVPVAPRKNCCVTPFLHYCIA